VAKKPEQPRNTDMARKIWLAGVGAYGRAFSEAQESLAKVTDDTSRVFDDLVARGEEIEDTVEERGRALAKRVNAPARSFDERIRKMRARLTADDDDSGERVNVLEARLDAIEAKLDLLLAAQKPAKPKSASKKKPS
jgi:polyhydroxyalkanoate synthesis regulator phasin